MMLIITCGDRTCKMQKVMGSGTSIRCGNIENSISVNNRKAAGLFSNDSNFNKKHC